MPKTSLALSNSKQQQPFFFFVGFVAGAQKCVWLNTFLSNFVFDWNLSEV
jgi:hypothetical protein